jgi:hypothetical protein
LGGFTAEVTIETRQGTVAVMDNIKLDWYVIRRQVLERDHYTCQRCGMLEKKGDRSLHVHHIIPVIKGGSDELDNLISVCHKCHKPEEAKSRSNCFHMPDVSQALVDRGRIREGYVSRIFKLPVDLDEKLRIRAVKDHIYFSKVVITALKEYLK